MAQDLRELDRLLRALSMRLTPGQLIKVSQRASIRLRTLNAKRIAANEGPDGQAFEPRKRDKDGKIRTRAKMFKKLRAARHLSRKVRAEGFEVGFLRAQTARLARVHHEGLRDRVEPGSGKTVKYPERPLLGFSLRDEEDIIDDIMATLDL